MTDDVLLETRALTKQFQGVIAVSNVNIRVRRGTIHALIGPNGAGKTTVFNLLTRFLVPTSGRIFYKGEDITSVPSGPARPPGNGAVVSDLGRLPAPDGA